MTKKKTPTKKKNLRPDIDTSMAERGIRAQEVSRCISDEIRKFTERLVKKYNQDGEDRRGQVAHQLEQAGISVRSELEREKRAARVAAWKDS